MKKKPAQSKKAPKTEGPKKSPPHMDRLAPGVDAKEGTVTAAVFLELQNDYETVKGQAIDQALQIRDLGLQLSGCKRELEDFRNMKPPKLDPKKIANALDTVLYSLLMDAKGALMASMDPSAAEVAIRISQMELNMPALTLTETMLVQRAKAMARKWNGGIEVDKDEIGGFFRLVEKLS